ncbi:MULTISPECIES: YicC/YloC family endoribonuclease [Paenibacillus]|uniref:YicC/YloC family endoribonuclease n=1 Tax=Paenibacillus TaxID=44249 RepID=UPI00129EC4EF|nr:MULTISPECIES: YicC/YloC family endoribonuclease [Paenibacillus]MBY0216630.1 YicC family protein [Paenibacillus illinoisensis]MCM3205832.1 YicC family protein [Paenibacillus illinoisensis]WJH28530.1 YicC family protein [Paenibacillus sp. CC-CFT742]
MSFSMTGYGQSAFHFGGYKVQLEIKSVNHRYCEVMMRMPKEWTCYEDGLRKRVQSRLKRGRIDVYVMKEKDEDQALPAVLNEQAVRAYLQAAEQLESRFGMQGKPSIMDMLSLPDVMVHSDGTSSIPEEEKDEWERVLQQSLEEALTSLEQMRAREGLHLASDLERRISRLESLHTEMLALAPTVVSDYRNKLRQRLTEMQEEGSFPFDEHKLGMEIAVFADRSNIEEELTRLLSHFGQSRELLKSEEPVGRKLDFLIQEMNREVNTIGSKANHLALVNRVVEMKAELEKIREQAANIE